MDYERELNRVQKDLDETYSKIESLKVTVATLDATHREQYTKIVSTLEQVNKDMKDLATSIKALESLATQGKTSLKTLLWIGGFVTAFATFMLNMSGYWFTK